MHHQHFYSILRQHGPRGRSGIARKTRRGPREARHIGRTHGRPIGAEAIYCAGITRRRIRAAAVPCFFLPSPRRVRDRSGRLPIPAAHPRARSHGHPIGPGPAFVRRRATVASAIDGVERHVAPSCGLHEQVHLRRVRAEPNNTKPRPNRSSSRSGHRSARREAHAIQAGRSDDTCNPPIDALREAHRDRSCDVAAWLSCWIRRTGFMECALRAFSRSSTRAL